MKIDKYIEEGSIDYKDDRIIILKQINDVKEVASSPIKAEWFIAILCTSGRAMININNEQQTLNKDNLLICHPQTIIESGMVNLGFNCCGFCLSPEYMKQMLAITASHWSSKAFLDENPILSLKPDECELFLQYYNLLKSKLIAEPHPNKKKLIDALLVAFMYEFHDALKKHIAISPPKYNSAETLFNSFIDLLNDSYPKERSVAFYANKLFVTPKYLSAICKDICGENASDIITRYMKIDLEMLLKNPNKTIKEICNELNFGSLSFFGKYVKRLFGVSPKEYRENLNLKSQQEELTL